MRTWHILDVGSIWMKEFASALQQTEPVIAWAPEFSKFGMLARWERQQDLSDPALTIHRFPMQRGYARAPLRWLVPFERRLAARLRARSEDPRHSPLVCTTPFYAPVAELWPGPVVYYVTDLTVAYEGLDPRQVLQLDRRMCRVARVVCPNSKRIGSYLVEQAGCAPGRICIVPNATRSSNIASAPRFAPGNLPEDIADLPRPILGILGDLSSNLDWELLAAGIRRTPHASWLFVGPTTRPIADPQQNAAREWTKTHARFVGYKPYGELQRYARCVDAAILPYRKHEPTYSGSSTRFYEHLAAGRPMIATRGFAELLEKEPLLTLVDTADELIDAIDSLAACDFRDGHEEARWRASRSGTWEERARRMHSALAAQEVNAQERAAEAVTS